MAELIDTHSHLYLEEFAEDRDSVIERAIQNGIRKILLPNINLHTLPLLHQLCDRYPAYCYPAIALHPTDLEENYREQCKAIENAAQRRKYWAIGETGLDLYWSKNTLRQQTESFIFHIELASWLDLPLIIHCRNSFPEIRKILKENRKENTRGVFHCFTGTEEEAAEIIQLGFLLGIGGVVTFKNAKLKDILVKIGTESLVLETDSPYLSPVPHRGKRNESSHLLFIADFLATVFQTTREEIAAITTTNANRVFGLDKSIV